VRIIGRAGNGKIAANSTRSNTTSSMPILTALLFYPIKSCGAIALREATLTAAGLRSAYIYDREWMVVDQYGNCLTQREAPRMALIMPRIRGDALELRAPGMLPLRIPLDLPDPGDAPALTVHIWNDTIKAYDCDAITAAWFSNAVGIACRLVRFHPDARRIADTAWTAGIEAPTLFSDGFPILVISEASLEDLNGKLLARNCAGVPMDRFRPNMVIGGIGAFEEDYASALKIGNAILKPVKPCPRCAIPSINQATGTPGPDPLDILQGYRANQKLNGSITFGMNAIVLAGDGEVLRVGQEVEAELRF
jgi:uncharacterized protein YcbX